MQELKRQHPHPAALNTQLQTVLSRLCQQTRDRPSYGVGNIINLLRALHLEGTDYNFSDLAVWQADLRGLEFRQANFVRSDLARSLLPHRSLQPHSPFHETDITGLHGLTPAQLEALKAFDAVERFR